MKLSGLIQGISSEKKNEKKNKIGFEKKWERYFKIGNFLLKYLFKKKKKKKKKVTFKTRSMHMEICVCALVYMRMYATCYALEWGIYGY